jgi:PKD repeat protein
MGETMNSFRPRLFLLCLISIAVASAALAQDWPLPAATPNTPVPCTSCAGKGSLLTAGYPPVLSYVGRFADAEAVTDKQAYWRTGRPRGIFVAPDRSRVYLLLGSSPAAYNIDSFFSRVAAHDHLQGAQGVPTNPSNGNASGEIFLWWDKFFYAEHGGGWVCPIVDGQDRLWRTGIDWDDRGILYLAYTVYGWGMVKDDGGTGGGWMDTIQSFRDASGETHPNYTPSPNDEVGFESILSVKTSAGDYYAFVSDTSASRSLVWKVNDSKNPQRLADRTDLSVAAFAKDATKTHIAIKAGTGQVKIYNANDIVDPSKPALLSVVRTDGGKYFALDSDGRNFYLFGVGTRGVNITVLVPNAAGSYDQRDFPITDVNGNPVTYINAGGIRAGGGMVAVFGFEGRLASGNVRLFKVTTDSQLTAIPLEVTNGGNTAPFFAQYYGSAAPAGYANPAYKDIMDVVPYAYKDPKDLTGRTHNYLIFGANIGDVWEVKTGDTLNMAVTRVRDTTNANSLETSAGPFYGDRQTFTSSLLSGKQQSVNWDFGDNTTGTTVTGTSSATIQHQYSGVSTVNALPMTKHVVATTAVGGDTLTSDTNITLARPTARFAMTRGSQKYLFLVPNASSTAPIVTSDSFVDASDGAVEGHFAEWNLDNSSTRLLPSDPFPVGGCRPDGSPHTVSFTAHYGPYTSSGGGLAPATASDLPLSISGTQYVARPFVVKISPPAALIPGQPVPPQAMFTSLVFATSTAADLPGGLLTAVNYEWQLIKAGSVARTTGQLSAKLGSIPVFPVDRSDLAGAQVKLIVTATGPVGSDCTPYAQFADASDVFNVPNPTLPVKTGCDTANAACSLSTTATSCTDAAPCVFTWTLQNSAGVTVASSTDPASRTFAPAITTAGTYTATVVAANSVAASTQSLTFSVAQPLCSNVPDSSNTGFGFAGAVCSGLNGSTGGGTGCTAGETINFAVSTYNWNPKEGCDTFSWTFGDGGTSSQQNPSHVYASNGSYQVTLVARGASGSSLTLSATVTVGVSSPPPPPPPPPPPTCQALTDDSAYVGYSGQQSHCSVGSACSSGEPVTFILSTLTYNFSCSTPAYVWNFGDSRSSDNISTLAIPTHTYQNAGTYQASVTVTNTAGSHTYPVSLTTSGGAPGGGGTCEKMYPDVNVGMSYQGTGCKSDSGGNCSSAASIQFTVTSYNYTFDCPVTTFAWDFGDGNSSTDKNPVHKYAKDGTYHVSLKITNSSGIAEMAQTITVGTPPPPPTNRRNRGH